MAKKKAATGTITDAMKAAAEQQIRTHQRVVDYQTKEFTVAFFVYYAGFEATLGRTPGKFLCGTRVVTNDGGEPSYGQALGRTLCRMIPFEAFSVLFTSQGIGWHDSIARTKVIRVR